MKIIIAPLSLASRLWNAAQPRAAFDLPLEERDAAWEGELERVKPAEQEFDAFMASLEPWTLAAVKRHLWG